MIKSENNDDRINKVMEPNAIWTIYYTNKKNYMVFGLLINNTI